MADASDVPIYQVPDDLATALDTVARASRLARAARYAELVKRCEGTLAADVLDEFLGLEAELLRHNDKITTQWLSALQQAYEDGRAQRPRPAAALPAVREPSNSELMDALLRLPLASH